MQCTLESILREALKKTLNVWLFTLFDKYIFKKKSLRFGKYLVIDVCHEKAKKGIFYGFLCNFQHPCAQGYNNFVIKILLCMVKL